MINGCWSLRLTKHCSRMADSQPLQQFVDNSRFPFHMEVTGIWMQATFLYITMEIFSPEGQLKHYRHKITCTDGIIIFYRKFVLQLTIKSKGWEDGGWGGRIWWNECCLIYSLHKQCPSILMLLSIVIPICKCNGTVDSIPKSALWKIWNNHSLQYRSSHTKEYPRAK